MATTTEQELRDRFAFAMRRVELGARSTVTRAAIAEPAPIRPRVFVPLVELPRSFPHLGAGEATRLRAEADVFFGDDGDRI